VLHGIDVDIVVAAAVHLGEGNSGHVFFALYRYYGISLFREVGGDLLSGLFAASHCADYK
jgi:hypothetical protein